MTAVITFRALLNFAAGGLIGALIGLVAGLALFMSGNDGSPPNPLLTFPRDGAPAQVRTTERAGVHVWQRCLDTCDELRP